MTDLTDLVRKIKTAAGHPGSWDALDAKLRSAIRRDARGGRNIIDGYPAATMGGSGGGASVLAVDDETGDEVRVPVTSVEAAVVSRLDSKRSADGLHREVERAREWLDEAARCVGAFVHCMEKIDALTETNVVPAHCASCATIDAEELDLDKPLRYGRVGDVLERQQHLCRSCYRFAENHRRLPTPEELQRYRAGKALRPFRDQAC